MRNTIMLAVFMISTGVFTETTSACDLSGLHGFFNDDRHQFVDVWYNTNAKVTIKASNGQRFRPMYLTVHVTYILNGVVQAIKHYSVMCESPTGGGGAETWYVFAGLGVSANEISVTPNKRSPTPSEQNSGTTILTPIR
jgi:hypothetical protein